MLDKQQVSALLFWGIFLISSALIAGLMHYVVRPMWGANLLTAIGAVLGLLVINTIHLGYFDPWLVIAIPIAGTVAAVVSFFIGAVLDSIGISRRKRSAKHVV